MAPRDVKPARSAPYYLTAPVGWQTAMEVKRRFAGSQPPIAVVGAASVDAAIGRLEDNPRCVAVLVHFAEQPRAAIELICRIKERWKRPVVCFHPGWHRDDVRRALQLGADSLLGWPFDPGEVLGDLEALHKNGVSVTRNALLERGGPALLAPDPALWVDEGEDWRDRLTGLAERMRTPAVEEPGRVTRIDPATDLTRAAGGTMTPSLAGATMTVLRVGSQHLPAVAGQYGVDAAQLERVVDVGLQVPDDGRRDGVLAWLEEMARAGVEEADSGVLAQLRRAAQVTLQGQGQLLGEIDVLANALSRAIAVPVPALENLSPALRIELSNRLLAGEETDDALGHVRMLVLSALLEELGQRSTTAHDLAALTALLGLRAGVEGIRPAELVRALARLDPPSAMQGLDLRRLASVRDAIPTPGNALDQLLRRAIDELLKAVAPMGYVDQNRLIGLLRAARQGGTALVGPTTWRTVAEVIAGRRRATEARAVKITRRLERLMAISGTDARGRLVRALGELIERSRNPMDADRFIGWCRDAAAGIIQTESTSGRMDPGAGALAGLDRVEMRADIPVESRPAAISVPGVDASSMLTGSPPSSQPSTASGPVFDPAGMLAAGPDRRSSKVAADGGSDAAAEGTTPGGGAIFDPTAMLGVDVGARPEGMLGSGQGSHPGGLEPSTSGGPAGSSMPDWLDPGGDRGHPSGPSSARRPLPTPPAQLVEAPPPTAALHAANALAARGDLEGLAAHAQRLPDDEPGAADALNRAALALYVGGRTEEADPLWSRAAALAPDRPNVLFHLARLRFEQGRRDEARLLVRQVLALRPHLSPAQSLRARLDG